MKDPYYIPFRRDLSNEERALLAFLLQQEAPQWLGQLATLKVIAKCGCGGCPTVLLGPSFESEPVVKDHYLLADYRGTTTAGGLVGVMLWANDGGSGVAPPTRASHSALIAAAGQS